MKAVILVGGEGTRLRPLTFTTPKSMLPVAGRPIIERVVSWAARHGIDEAVLSMGYRPDAFLAAYPDGYCNHVHLHYAVEPEPLETAGAIAFAARHAGLTETFVVVNGDVLTALDLTGLISLHRARRAKATIALTPVEDPSRYGVVNIDGRGRVTAFIEKPAPGEAPTNFINAGTYVLEPDVVEAMPPGERLSIERVTFPSLAAEGTLYALASDADWIDAGTATTYVAANLAYAAKEDTWLGPGAHVDPSARVSDTVLGPDATVEAGADVKGSVVLPAATIEPMAVVFDSIVGPGATVGRGARVEALTVLGADVVVEPGAELSGARVPEVTS